MPEVFILMYWSKVTSVDQMSRKVLKPLLLGLLGFGLAQCGGQVGPTAFRYHLTDSTILFLPSLSEVPVQEPLSGTFTVVRSQPRVFNSDFDFTITDLEFQGGSRFIVRGDPTLLECESGSGVGAIGSSTLVNPPAVDIFACVAINGQPVGLDGAGPLPISSYPPPLLVMEACGAPPDLSVTCDDISNHRMSGYQLRIVAALEG